VTSSITTNDETNINPRIWALGTPVNEANWIAAGNVPTMKKSYRGQAAMLVFGGPSCTVAGNGSSKEVSSVRLEWCRSSALISIARRLAFKGDIWW
jgi:hypothetical protein